MLVLLFYKHFAKYVPGMSHIGLGNNALFTAKCLKELGVTARPVGVNTVDHVRQAVRANPGTTHAVVEGTWFPPADLEQLAAEFPAVEWTCREHSQLSFLVVQRNGIEYARGYGAIHDRTLNFVFSANSERFCRYWRHAYNQPCPFLPNLYPLAHTPHPRHRRANVRDVLRVSAFGAQRVLKNHTTAAAAALLLARRLGRDLELHINVGREPGGDPVTRGVRGLLAGVPWARLVEHPWGPWAEFRHHCAAMDVALCPTFTETFCLTAADHVAAGVPVVGTDAVEWLPRHWMAEADSAEDIARVGSALVLDPDAGDDGLNALRTYVERAGRLWLDWLGMRR